MPDDRYTLRKAADGTWSVVDIFSDYPAEFGDRIMIRMNKEEADDMVDLLNILDRHRRSAQKQ
ncbi:hypothetical protein [Aurantimonas endophytica]|uniref:Uncharacterized protein n=1 Tax=Aurantimonas endophytica TaxID=1522175 RepID=A0A7W6MPR7_9HYPH|nr:hypothetical protein [Aurantimonas endophytica]MBB4003230.1 hypothetical protein [Aurantimonas endophytica]MCO6404093.1 hypothetical protein [Aurantimonas endophytica]